MNDNSYNLLPSHMQGAMKRYIENGIEPGSFLAAVLSNDLMGALRKGDETNQRALLDYGRFLYSYAPCGCFGSVYAYDEWVKSGGLKGGAA